MSPAPVRRHLLFVCTGNVCRSPAAELLLASGLGGQSGITVSSAGLMALAGHQVAEPMARLLRGQGVDATGFVARQLMPETVAAADLVLTMTAEQRSAVVSRVPAAVRRTFTLAEFAGLVSILPDGPWAGGSKDRLGELIAAAPSARVVRHGPGQDDDIPDPYGRGDAAFARAMAQIVAAVDRLLDALGAGAAHPA